MPTSLAHPVAAIACCALIVAATVAGAVGPTATAAAQSQGTPATVSIIHGLPKVDADVYVDGKLTLRKFEPETVTDPLQLPAGRHTVDLRSAGAPASDTPLITASVDVSSGANLTVIAHLTTDGSPLLTTFRNDLRPTPAGQGRLVVRHTAAAPAVDVLTGSDRIMEDLGPSKERTLDLPAGTVSVGVAARGTTDPVVGPVDLPLAAGQQTIVYVIGSLDDGTLDAALQTIEVGEQQGSRTAVEGASADAPGSEDAMPAGIPSGTGGLAARGRSTFPVPLGLALGGVALLGIATSTRSLRSARRRAG